jgi:hypothetical protein
VIGWFFRVGMSHIVPLILLVMLAAIMVLSVLSGQQYGRDQEMRAQRQAVEAARAAQQVAQQQSDAQALERIRAISADKTRQVRAIDNHAHRVQEELRHAAASHRPLTVATGAGCAADAAGPVALAADPGRGAGDADRGAGGAGGGPAVVGPGLVRPGAAAPPSLAAPALAGAAEPRLTLGAIRLWNAALRGAAGDAELDGARCPADDPAAAACAADAGLDIADLIANGVENARRAALNAAQLSELQAVIQSLRPQAARAATTKSASP